MILDTSAIVAIWNREPGFEKLSESILAAESVHISAATLVELYAVLDDRDKPENQRHLDQLLEAYSVTVEAFSPEQAAIARQAYRDYGRGSGHKAHLNLGDCYSYALATTLKQPLLFVGNDFTHTDITAVP